MAKVELKEKVVNLRKKGLTYGEIVKQTGATKSSVSNWCRNIVLTIAQKEHIKNMHSSTAVASLLKVAEARRHERFLEIEKCTKIGIADIGKLSNRDLLLIGIGLYWGEGYKHGNDEFGITNSDPKMISFIIYWLKNCYGVSKEDLTLRISINQIHKNRITEVEQYWSKITGINLKQFTKTSSIVSTSKKVYSDKSVHFGTIRIKVSVGRCPFIYLQKPGNGNKIT